MNANVDVYDPWVSIEEAEQAYGITPLSSIESGKYDAIILAVAHEEICNLGAEQIKKYGKENHIIYDIKHVLNADEVDGRL
jgi:UDP-N-acetyl-D-galactosamine dehydrogenase